MFKNKSYTFYHNAIFEFNLKRNLFLTKVMIQLPIKYFEILFLN